MANEEGFTSVGAFIEVSSTLPTAQTTAGFAGITTWEEVGGVDTIGELRRTRNTSTRTPLKTGEEVVVAGSSAYEPFTVDGAIVRADPGQELLELHLDNGVNLSFRITYGDGGTACGVALVTAGGQAPGESSDAFAGMAYELKPSGAVVKANPA